MTRGLLLALSLAAAAVGQRITAPAEVRFGAAFEVSVEVRGAFDPAALAPLEVEVLERRATGRGERVRLRARCYELGEVQLAGEPGVRLQVQSALPTPPGELEWPADGYEAAASSSSRLQVAGWTALLIVCAFAAWRRLVPARAAAPDAVDAPRWSAAAALRDLDVAAADREAVLLRVKAILRRHLAERFGVPADVRTSEELLGLVPAADAGLRPCLRDIDVALFSPGPAAEDAPARSRERALTFVERTEGGA